MKQSNYFETFKIKASDVDVNSNIKLFELVNYMQEVAWNHATLLGFSTYVLLKQNMSWILNQQHFEFFSTPKHGDTIKVETWPAGMDRFFAYRNFNVFDSDGNLILTSVTKWLLIDTIARKMIAVPESVAVPTINFERSSDEYQFKKIFPPKEEPISSFPITVGWSDLDVNGHINNSIYFKWLSDALDEKILSERSLKSLQIIFKTEGLLNETLVSKYWTNTKNHTQHSISETESNRELIAAKIEFNIN